MTWKQNYEEDSQLNSKKILAAAVSVAAIASACGGVKDVSRAPIPATPSIGTTDKVTGLDPPLDNGSYAVQIEIVPFLRPGLQHLARGPDIAADDGTRRTMTTIHRQRT